MKSNNCIVSKNDYEFYSIIVPYSYIFLRNKKEFLYGKLEKMHPCFSADYDFKSRLKIRNKKLNSDVVVIKTDKLNEYKKKYPDKKIWIPELQSVYGGFDKNKTLFVSVLLFLLFGTLILLGNRFVTVESEIKNVDFQPQLVDEKIQSADKEILKTILEIIRLNNGEIEYLNYWYINDKPSFEIKLNSVYPEKFMDKDFDCNVKNVVYSNGKPTITLSSRNNTNKTLKQNKVNLNYFSDIREIIRSSGCSLINENPDENYFKFQISEGKYGFNVFTKINDYLLNKKIGIEKIKIKAAENQKYLVELFISDKENDLDLNLISDSSKLFKVIYSIRPVKIKNNNAIEIIESNKKVNEISLKKLGEIKKTDGSIITFYKQPDGKITKVIGAGYEK